jgi:predicted phage baseplate assembly protein
VRWHEVPDFWGSGPRDRHYTFDAETGVVTFGDGSNGLPPPVGLQNVRAAYYRSGGGPSGDVGAGVLTQLKTTLALVDKAVNQLAASGGAAVEPEDVLVDRATRTLRHGGRAVTAQDFSDLALEASTVVARAVTITPSFSPVDQADGAKTGPDDLHRDGKVIVVIVSAEAEAGKSPTTDVIAEVEDYLRARCAPGATVEVTGPSWVGVTVQAHVAARSIEDEDALRVRVADAVTAFLHPLTGGVDGRGWDFGRRPRASDLTAAITAVPGVDHLVALTVTCDAPFDDVDDETVNNNTKITIDKLSLFSRLLIYPRSIQVTT